MTGNGQAETIAAIATAPGEAGIAIVRVSGPAAFRIADEVFRCPAPPPSQRAGNTFVHGYVHEDAQELDEALLLIMRAPHSYTGEDAIEIQGHGGSVPAQRILRRVLESGARIAEPGEFTRRAFLNGRLDLAQAEAVLDLIRARSDRAASAALEQLDGALSLRINAFYDGLLQLAADIEASLDFPEDELPATVLKDLTQRTSASQAQLADLLSTFSEGHLLREGARVVIAGRPNAGKSTLLNALLGKDRAIVSHHPGTTRDTIEELVIIDGIPVRLIDTAGLRDTDCDIEKSGILRTINELQSSDLCLYVIDASLPLHDEDRRQMAKLASSPCLLIRNKVDLGDAWPNSGPAMPSVSVSLLRMDGVQRIAAALTGLLTKGGAWSATPHATISERHRSLLQTADAALREVATLLCAGARDLDLAASRLRDALEQVGRITGRVYESELLDSIFSRFCIGK